MCRLNLSMYNLLNFDISFQNSLTLNDPFVFLYRTKLELKYNKLYKDNNNLANNRVNLANNRVNLANNKVNLANNKVNYKINILNKRLFAVTIETPKKNKFIEIKEKINNNNIYIKTFVTNNKITQIYESDFDLV